MTRAGARGRPLCGSPRTCRDRVRRVPSRDRAGRRRRRYRRRAERDRHRRRRRAREAAPRGVSPRAPEPRRRPGAGGRVRGHRGRRGLGEGRRACVASPCAAPCPTSASGGPTSSSTDRRRARANVSSGSARVLLAIDQGTTGTTCLVVDDGLTAVGRGYREISQHYPRARVGRARPARAVGERARDGRRQRSPTPGSRRVTCRRSGSRTSARRRSSGSARPGDPCTRRSSGRTGARPHGVPRCPSSSCASARASSATRTSRRRSSSGSSTVSTARKAELAFGTVDSWIAWNLTGGAAHVTDVTNASRTMLLDLETGAWDDELLDLFSVDRCRAPDRRAVLPASSPRRRCSARRAARRHRRRSAGGALRSGLLRAGRDEGDVRHRHLRARARRRACRAGCSRAAQDRRRGACRGARPVRGGRIRARRRRSAPVAEGRARADRRPPPRASSWRGRRARTAASSSCRR